MIKYKGFTATKVQQECIGIPIWKVSKDGKLIDTCLLLSTVLLIADGK